MRGIRSVLWGKAFFDSGNIVTRSPTDISQGPSVRVDDNPVAVQIEWITNKRARSFGRGQIETSKEIISI